MKELPRKQPPNVSGGIGNIGEPCTDTPYVPGKTPIIDEPFPAPGVPGPDYPPSPCEPNY